MEINYTKYNAKSLLEALSTIDAEAYPENYKTLTAEISLRKHEIEEFYSKQENARKLKWCRLLRLIAFNQILVAIVALVMLVFSYSILTTIEVIGSLFIALLNGVSGVALLKRASSYCFLSYLNIGLQVIAFGLGGIYFNYYGLGGVFLTIDWISDSYNWLSASFHLGGSLLEYSDQYELGFIQVDVLAIFYIWVIHKSLSKSVS
ncbi:hypothetical protein [Vibrio alginolyticus]|uniref:hypothetical protein n=1 Tax=Vibrio alginolyticus TaxID=663 RepID=UPI003D7D94D0